MKEIFVTNSIFDADRAVAALEDNGLKCFRSSSDLPTRLKIGYGRTSRPIKISVAEKDAGKATDILTQIGLIKL